MKAATRKTLTTAFNDAMEREPKKSTAHGQAPKSQTNIPRHMLATLPSLKDITLQDWADFWAEIAAADEANPHILKEPIKAADPRQIQTGGDTAKKADMAAALLAAGIDPKTLKPIA